MDYFNILYTQSDSTTAYALNSSSAQLLLLHSPNQESSGSTCPSDSHVESPISPWWTHAATGRTCKLHSLRPEPESIGPIYFCTAWRAPAQLVVWLERVNDCQRQETQQVKDTARLTCPTVALLIKISQEARGITVSIQVGLCGHAAKASKREECAQEQNSGAKKGSFMQSSVAQFFPQKKQRESRILVDVQLSSICPYKLLWSASGENERHRVRINAKEGGIKTWGEIFKAATVALGKDGRWRGAESQRGCGRTRPALMAATCPGYRSQQHLCPTVRSPHQNQPEGLQP